MLRAARFRAAVLPCLETDVMKKKGPRIIPDFSRKPKGVPAPGQPASKGQPAPHPSAAIAKPRLTDKPGRRGQ